MFSSPNVNDLPADERQSLREQIYHFATDAENGLGMDNSSAQNFVNQWLNSRRGWNLEQFQQTYREAYRFACGDSLHGEGLGLYSSFARDYAIHWAIEHYGRDFARFEATYRAQFAHAVEPITEGGLGMGRGLAKQYALSQAKRESANAA
jgi:hypothetical protein